MAASCCSCLVAISPSPKFNPDDDDGGGENDYPAVVDAMAGGGMGMKLGQRAFQDLFKEAMEGGVAEVRRLRIKRSAVAYYVSGQCLW